MRLDRKWKITLREQEPTEELEMLSPEPLSAWLTPYPEQPNVTLEIQCNGEIVLAFHSPNKAPMGEVYTLKLVDGRSPLEVLQEDLRDRGLAL